jgi:hypothetical protein
MEPRHAMMTDRDEAAHHLDAFLARLDHLALEDLRLLALPLPDPVLRAAVLDEVNGAAAMAGRTALVDEARRRARDAIVTAYDRHLYDPTWAGLNWGRSLGTAKDRLGLTLAAEDAAVAAVMSDVLDEDLAESLAEGFEHAAGMSGATTTPSLSLDRPGAQGWLVRIVFVAMAIAAIGVAFVAGVAQLAVGLIVGIVGSRRRGSNDTH